MARRRKAARRKAPARGAKKKAAAAKKQAIAEPMIVAEDVAEDETISESIAEDDNAILESDEKGEATILESEEKENSSVSESQPIENNMGVAVELQEIISEEASQLATEVLTVSESLAVVNKDFIATSLEPTDEAISSDLQSMIKPEELSIVDMTVIEDQGVTHGVTSILEAEIVTEESATALESEMTIVTEEFQVVDFSDKDIMVVEDEEVVIAAEEEVVIAITDDIALEANEYEDADTELNRVGTMGSDELHVTGSKELGPDKPLLDATASEPPLDPTVYETTRDSPAIEVALGLTSDIPTANTAIEEPVVTTAAEEKARLTTAEEEPAASTEVDKLPANGSTAVDEPAASTEVEKLPANGSAVVEEPAPVVAVNGSAEEGQDSPIQPQLHKKFGKFRCLSMEGGESMDSVRSEESGGSDVTAVQVTSALPEVKEVKGKRGNRRRGGASASPGAKARLARDRSASTDTTESESSSSSGSIRRRSSRLKIMEERRNNDIARLHSEKEDLQPPSEAKDAPSPAPASSPAPAPSPSPAALLLNPTPAATPTPPLTPQPSNNPTLEFTASMFRDNSTSSSQDGENDPAPPPASQISTLPLPPPPPHNSDISLPTFRPVKVKSRWRRSSELEMGGGKSSDSEVGTPPPGPASPMLAVPTLPTVAEVDNKENVAVNLAGVASSWAVNAVALKLSDRLRAFAPIEENLYLTERKRSKEVKRMTCDCFLTKEEIQRGDVGCGEDCLNRLLMIECGSRCPLGDRCTNRRFQRREYCKCEVFKTEKKGFGLRAVEDVSAGGFLLEYVGEVLDPKEFRRRAKDYAREKNAHYYFMALKSDTIIDATMKGNTSRFINHSCDPNSETQKWTVNGELRIGFFAKRAINAGEEITFDYQLQRYGKEAQRCYCASAMCRGWIGEDPEKEKDEERERFKKERREKKKSVAESVVTPPTTVTASTVTNNRKKEVALKEFLEDMDLEEEIEKLARSGLKNRNHTLTLCRLMVRAEDAGSRCTLLALLRNGDQPCRRLFLDYHGLRLVWSWMVDADGGKGQEGMHLKMELLKTLASLPVPNKTMLQDSKVLGVVEKWARELDVKTAAEEAEAKEDPKSELEVEAKAEASTENGGLSEIPVMDEEVSLEGKPTEAKLLPEQDVVSKTLTFDKNEEQDGKKTPSTDSSRLSAEDDDSSQQFRSGLENAEEKSDEPKVESETSGEETNSEAVGITPVDEANNQLEAEASLDSAVTEVEADVEVTQKVEVKLQGDAEPMEIDSSTFKENTDSTVSQEAKMVSDVTLDSAVTIASETSVKSNEVANSEVCLKGELLEPETGDKSEEKMDSTTSHTQSEPASTQKTEPQPELESLEVSAVESKAEERDPIEEEMRKQVADLTLSLLEIWSSLKEVFRIPKKERIEQMKEHEREADQGYKEDGDRHEPRNHYDRFGRSDRYRSDYDRRDRKRRLDSPDRERSRKAPRVDERTLVQIPRMSKEERRQLFALRVAQEEEEGRQRRQQEELWRQHEERCQTMGLDPMQTPMFDPYLYYYEHGVGPWQTAPPDTASQPPESSYESCYHPDYVPPEYYEYDQTESIPEPDPIPGYYYYNGMMLAVADIPLPDESPTEVPFLALPDPTPDPDPVCNTVFPEMPSEWAEEEEIDPVALIPLPPCSPPEPKAEVQLPPKWKQATDSEGRVYYYHIKRRCPQWLPPQWGEDEDEDDDDDEDEDEEEEDEDEEEEDEEEVEREETIRKEESEESEEDEELEKESTSSTEDDEQRLEVKVVEQVRNGEVAEVEDEAEEDEGVEEEELEEGEIREDVIPVAAAAPKLETLSEGQDPMDEEDEGGRFARRKEEKHERRKRRKRAGLVQERIISPRREQDKEDLERYREIKEKVKKRVEQSRRGRREGEPVVGWEEEADEAKEEEETETKEEEDTKKKEEEEEEEEQEPPPPPKKPKRKEEQKEKRESKRENKRESKRDSKRHPSSRKKEKLKSERKKDSKKESKLKEVKSKEKTTSSSTSSHGSNSKLEKPTTAPADTSSDSARRIKDAFRVKMAGWIVQCLNPYRKQDCKAGRITSTEDFKHLARKLTHFVMLKELKHCQRIEDLECNDSVKHKARDFIRKYMTKFGGKYQRSPERDEVKDEDC